MVKANYRWMNKIVLALMIVLAVLVTGCSSHLVTGTVENKIKDRLPELIGPAKDYDVNVHGSTRKLMSGWISDLEIHGTQVWVTPDIYADEFVVKMKDLKADTKSYALKSVGDVTFDAVVSQDSLNQYLSSVRSDGIKVELLNGNMVVKAKSGFLGLSTNVDLTGRLVPHGQKLDFEIDRLKVWKFSAPSMAIQAVESRINPVIDLNKIGSSGFSPEIRSVTIVPGAIRLDGTARMAEATPTTNMPK